jgi:hypothetical protein
MLGEEQAAPASAACLESKHSHLQSILWDDPDTGTQELSRKSVGERRVKG